MESIKKIAEFELKKKDRAAIAHLFNEVFEGYPDGAHYYNQVPDFRLLTYVKSRLTGHVGIHHRMINVSGLILSVFGIADLCVASDRQQQNVGSQLLQHVTQLATKSEVDFIVLTSEVDAFYQKNGFKIVQNPCRWLVIHNHESMGVLRRSLPQGLMVKQTGVVDWPEGEVDFMGHMF